MILHRIYYILPTEARLLVQFHDERMATEYLVNLNAQGVDENDGYYEYDRTNAEDSSISSLPHRYRGLPVMVQE